MKNMKNWLNAVAGGNINEVAQAETKDEFQFPLLLNRESIQEEIDATMTVVDKLTGNNKQNVTEAVENLINAALMSSRYNLNFRIHDEATGGVLDSLFDSNGRSTTRREVWLNCNEISQRLSLGKFEPTKKDFKLYIERFYQASREDAGESAPAQDANEVDALFPEDSNS